MHYFILGTLLASLLCGCSQNAPSKQWIDLFNGQDLSGWEIGKDNNRTQFTDGDSLSEREIFTVKNGVIHVYPGAAEGSKQSRAVITHKSVWSHYRLQVEYRWLEKRFSSRENSNRDAGILVHVHRGFNVWPDSIEMQMGDGRPGEKYVTGDLWVLQKVRAKSPSQNAFYDAKAELGMRGYNGTKNSSRNNLTPIHAEKPRGEWNTAELIVRGHESVHFYLNGVLVNEVYDMETLHPDDVWKPLKEGRVSLQAEWAELEYRAVRIKHL